MSMKKKSDPPSARAESGFKAAPLLDAPSDFRKRIADAGTDDEKIEIIREIASSKDTASIPVLADIYTDRSSSDSLSEEAYEAIRCMGAGAISSLSALSSLATDGFVKTCLSELTCEITIDELSKNLEPGTVRSAVQAFADLSAGSHLVEPLRELLVNAGVAAVPELIVVADTHEHPVIADCAIVFLSDIAHENPGKAELLEAIPMLGRQIHALEDIEVDPEIIRLIRSGPNEAAAKSLLILRTIHPRFSVVSNAIDLLRELWDQNPDDERISECALGLLEKLGTKDPILNDQIYQAIREIGGISPPFSKRDKGEN